MSIETDITKLKEGVKIDNVRAMDILEKFSQQVVTPSEDRRLFNNIRTFFTMEGNGIALAIKTLAFILVLGVIAIVGNVFGLNKLTEDDLAQITVIPTPSVTPVVSVIATAKDVEAVTEEVNSIIAELDDMQKEIDTLDSSFSTTESDALDKELNSLK